MRPSKLLLGWLVIWLLVAVLITVLPVPFMLWLTWGLAIGLVGLIDAVFLWKKPLPLVRRQVMAALSLGVSADVELSFKVSPAGAARYIIYDHYPKGFQAKGLPQNLELPAPREQEEVFTIKYTVLPLERGELTFKRVACLGLSPLGLWWRHTLCGKEDTVRVYPNFRSVARYALLAREGKTGQLGIKVLPKRGQGLDFHELREYYPGDSLRFVDWKATSKYRKLIARDYKEEQDQQVVFLLDCGFRMHAKDNQLSHFDHVLNAMLLLCYTALKQGDSICLYAFGQQRRWLAPVKGVSALNHFLNTVYDLKTSVAPADLGQALEDVMLRLRRRSLIILLTNLREEDTEGFLSVARTVQKRHLILTASLRETVLDNTLQQELHTFDNALSVAAAHQYLTLREEARNKLKASGLLYFDEVPEKLPSALVNRYWDIKKKGLL